MENEGRACFAGFQSHLAKSVDMRRTNVYCEVAVAKLTSLSVDVFKHEPARLRLDGTNRFPIQITEGDADIVISFRNCDRKKKWLVARAALRVRGHPRPRLKPIAAFRTKEVGGANAHAAIRRLTNAEPIS